MCLNCWLRESERNPDMFGFAVVTNAYYYLFTQLVKTPAFYPSYCINLWKTNTTLYDFCANLRVIYFIHSCLFPYISIMFMYKFVKTYQKYVSSFEIPTNGIGVARRETPNRRGSKRYFHISNYRKNSICTSIRGPLQNYPTLFFYEHLMDLNLARLHEATLNFSAHAWIFSRLLITLSGWARKCIV